jgi:DNA polymerase-3 subunit gamma/tau
LSHQSLARKYRPSRFSELVGQDSVGKALTSAIALGRPTQGVIFTGVRGVGKTTVARLYAKALNCEALGAGSEPCSQCASCLAITAGRHEDVLEIDGASNTGVGDVRALQETLAYVPQRSKYKVYIIDEVHMLSQAAFNALLKTLEEPPAHVIFVFATTELVRVPETIRSRCQTYHLRKLPVALVRDRLAAILATEGITADERALAAIAREGHGSMRDALTMLDQAIAVGGGQVTVAATAGIVTQMSSSPFIDLLSAMAQRDAAAGMRTVAALDQDGAEFRSVAEQVAQLARHAFVIRDLGPKALDVALLGLDDAETAKLFAVAQAAAPFDLNRIFRTLVKCRGELDGSALDRFVLENYLCEWCLDPGLPDVEALMSGAAAKPVAAPAPILTAPVPARPAAPSPVVAPVPPVTSVPVPKADLTPPPGEFFGTWRQLVDAWKQRKPLQARKLEEAHPVEFSAAKIVIAVNPESFASKSLLQRDEQLRIMEQFRELFGFKGTLTVVPSAAQKMPDALRAGHDGAPIEAPKAGATAAAPLPDTILTERSREDAERKAKLIEETRNAPFTKEILATIGGTIEDVKVHS